MQPLFLLTLVTDDTYSFETPDLPQNLKTYEKIKYTCPSYWNNLVRGRRAAKVSKQHKSLEPRGKNWYRSDMAITDEREYIEFEASRNAIKVLSLNLEAQNMALLNVGYLSQYVFSIAYKL